MGFTVGELSNLTGVTVRTLHHYDEIGLVKPSRRSEAGYRLYEDDDVLRLQRVLILRELGMPLEEIAAALEGADHEALLRKHRDALADKRARLDRMLAAVDATLADLAKGRAMTNETVKKLFDGFDPAAYEAEAEARWGETDAYQESQRRTKRYGPREWEQIKAEAAAIYERIAARMKAGAPPDDAAVLAAVVAHREHISRWFYPCNAEFQKNLGRLYVDDPRFTANLDQVAPGFARYLADAIAAA